MDFGTRPRSLILPLCCTMLILATAAAGAAQNAAEPTVPTPAATPAPHPPEAVPPPRVAICHVGPNATDVAKRRTLRLPPAALREHLEHGDALGACAP
jgi:hypothetical protein